MKFSQKRLSEFAIVYQVHYGKSISLQEAEVILNALVKLLIVTNPNKPFFKNLKKL